MQPAHSSRPQGGSKRRRFGVLEVERQPKEEQPCVLPSGRPTARLRRRAPPRSREIRQVREPRAVLAGPPKSKLAVRRDRSTERRTASRGAEGPRCDAVAVPEENGLAVGQLVVVRGLQSRTGFNGLCGRLVGYSAPADRCSVVLSSGEAIRVHSRHLEAAPVPFALERRNGQMASAGSTSQRPPSPKTVRPGLTLRLSDEQSWDEAPTILAEGGRLLSTSVLRPDRWPSIAGIFADLPSTCNLVQASRAIFHAVARPPEFYICGGCDGQTPLSSVECFSITPGKWSLLPSMLEEHDAAASAVLGRHLYICGGNSRQGASSHVERFDPAIGAWQVMPSMSQRRSFAAVVVLAEHIYIIGGGASSNVPLDSAEYFNPTERAWKQLPPMLEARTCPAAVAIGRRIYVCGGANLTPLSSTECYDIMAENWRKLMPMTQGRFFAAQALIGQRYYVCGGCGGSRPNEADGQASLSSVERFDAGTEVWEQLPPMLEPRCGAAAAVSSGGRVHVCGGCPYTCGESLKSTESFDPSTGMWETMLPMKYCRTFGAGVVALGHLYVCGGSSAGRVTRVVERMNLATAEWEEVASMNSTRIGATGAAATLTWQKPDAHSVR